MQPEKSPQSSDGLRWLGVTTRIPLLHARISWPEFIQGNLVSAATALALVPLMTTFFGLSFEEAVAMSFLHSVILSLSWWLFGEPYSPGWLTPALPFVITLLTSSPDLSSTERIQMMTALSLDFTVLLFLFGITGLGSKLVHIIPDVLKGAIILGAGLAAFIKVFDISVETNLFNSQPVAASVAIAISLLLAFSEPVARWSKQYPMVARIAAMGLLPGFLLGGVAGGITGELSFDIEWGIYALPFGSLFDKVSPFVIGWPSLDMFINGLPLALIAYVLFFGDLLTGDAILEDAAKERPDDTPDINHTRTHLTVGVRNALMAVFAPFFPTQGVLWTGIQVVVAQRWRQGAKSLRTLHDGIASYYLFGLPLIFCLAPLVTGIKPMMPIALAMTLALTGFACTYIALAKAKTNGERGAMVLAATFLALLEPRMGLAFAVITIILLVDLQKQPDSTNS
ncbi:hypothetical protein [Endozoicomonas arenosclerae]|uniref:hypothetical protein n=1 Tax=Endozoicomonas arenosclerae TaxID=1633495 RepID=UPI0007833B85|nr:hypothetical protein [Endozoicomonas arenosclerae]